MITPLRVLTTVEAKHPHLDEDEWVKSDDVKL